MSESTYSPPRATREPANLSAVPYLPGLDGLRALAVIAVMVYHANPGWLAGGYLGVEVFFVISGYLITLLLMAEREQSGRINLGAFWARRARRLLPAMFFTLFLVLTYAMIFKSSVLGALRGDLLAAIFYVSNWYQIWVGHGYTAGADWVPLRHLWSLAVEEQFYIVWPVVMVLLMRRGGTRRLALTARWLVIASLAITVVVAVLYYPGRIGECDVTPDAYWNVGGRCISKMDFLYLATPTRATGLLLGSAMAMVWRPKAIMRSQMRDRGPLLDLVAVVGLMVLAALCWFVPIVSTDHANAILFRGGLFVTGVASLTLIAAVTHRHTVFSRVFALPPLLWAGTRSYGLYLYHWPIFLVIRKIAGNVLTLPQFIVAMIATSILTEFSYRMIEMPIRRREFAAWWDSLRRRPSQVPRQAMGATVVICLLLLAIGVIRLGLAEVKPNEVALGLEAGAQNTVSIDELLGDGTEPPSAGTVPNTTVPSAAPQSTVPGTTTTTTSTTTTTTTIPTGPVNYLSIGDSVMLGAAGVLTDRGYTVNAEQSRQMIDMVPVMQRLKEAGVFDDVVVIHLGTNGPFDKETLDAFLAPLSEVPNVIMLNVHANRSWTASNNQLLADRDVDGDNIILIDWNAKAAECAGNCFAADGIHLSADGQQFYANLIGDWTGK